MYFIKNFIIILKYLKSIFKIHLTSQEKEKERERETYIKYPFFYT